MNSMNEKKCLKTAILKPSGCRAVISFIAPGTWIAIIPPTWMTETMRVQSPDIQNFISLVCLSEDAFEYDGQIVDVEQSYWATRSEANEYGEYMLEIHHRLQIGDEVLDAYQKHRCFYQDAPVDD